MAYTPIPNNPYIVGNPIQSSNMFYGRNEDFLYIKDKLEKETKGLIITLAGDRRSGKTSILFQIMNGRLGEDYIPFFVDMQAMAAVESDAQFLAKMDTCIRQHLKPDIAPQDYVQNCWKTFEDFLDCVEQKYPHKKFIFLIDEYELIEYKIDKKLISEELITFFANLMENRNVYFIFTGSNKLEERQTLYWKTLFSKSQYRKITFLKHNDCLALITKPLEGFVIYTEEQQEKIWRLTAGQPFYTQIFCQNMVDRLQMEKHNEVLEEDIDAVIADIVDNPMPQMIYFWQELDARHKLAMSVLAEVLQVKEDWADSQKLMNTLAAHKLNLAITENDIHTALEEMYHRDILSKKDREYQFRVDMFRFWVKQEQNVWKLLQELNLEKPENSAKPYKFALAVILLVFIVSSALALWLLKPKNTYGDSKNGEARRLVKQANSYYEDANYALALKTVENAIKADSLYLKACLLRADVLKAMNRNAEALSAYQKSEKLYSALAANIGKKIGTIPDSLCNDTTFRNWHKNGNFLILDNSDNVSRYVYWMFPASDETCNLAIFNTRFKTWGFRPQAQYLAQRKNLLYYYDFGKNLIAAYDAKTTKTLWTYKPRDLPNKYRYYLAASNTRKWKSKYLTIYNRKGIYVLNALTGKEYAKHAYDDLDLKFCLQDDVAKKLVLSTDSQFMIHELNTLKQVKIQARHNGSNSIIFSSGDQFIQSYYPYLGQRNFYRFNPKTNSLDSLTSDISEKNLQKLVKSSLIFSQQDTLYLVPGKSGVRTKIFMEGNQAAETMHTNHSSTFGSNEIFIRGKDDVFLLTSAGKLLYKIPRKMLGEGNANPEPRVLAYDKYRKRIIYTMPVGGEAKSDARIVGVYDLKQQKVLFSNRSSKSYSFIYPYKHLYVLAEGNYDYRLLKPYYDLLLINPVSFQIMPYTGVQGFEPNLEACTMIKDDKVFELTSYPNVDERMLQRIHENLILFYSSFQILDKLQTTFDKMLTYVRNLNNLGVSQAVVACVIKQAPEDLGFYASKLSAIDANFSQVKTMLLNAMNLVPNSAIPSIKAQDSQFVIGYGNNLIVAKNDLHYDYITYSILRNGKFTELFTFKDYVPEASLADGIHLYYQKGEKSLLWILDKQGNAYSYPPPFSQGSKVVMDWLDDNTAFYLTQKQKDKNYAYELGTIGKADGTINLLSRWNSALSLKGTVVHNGHIGLIYTDSLAATYYMPAWHENPLLPPLSKITAFNAKPINTAAELNPGSAEEFILSYYPPYQSQTAPNNIRLSKEQFSQALFGDMLSSTLQWFDPNTRTISPSMEFIKLGLRGSEIDHFDETNIANGTYLHTSIWADVQFMQVADLRTGRITCCGGSGLGPTGYSFGYSWPEWQNICITWQETGITNSCKLTCQSLDNAGVLKNMWSVTVPWSYAYVMDTTAEYLIAYSIRQKQNGEEGRALLYINRKTGSIDRFVNLFSQTSILIFDDKPVLLHDPQLGFLDPLIPQ